MRRCNHCGREFAKARLVYSMDFMELRCPHCDKTVNCDETWVYGVM